MMRYLFIYVILIFPNIVFSQTEFNIVYNFIDTAEIGNTQIIKLNCGLDSLNCNIFTLNFLGEIECNDKIKYNVITVFKKFKVSNGYRGYSYLIFKNTASGVLIKVVVDKPDELPYGINNNNLLFFNGDKETKYKLKNLTIGYLVCFPIGCYDVTQMTKD